MHSRIASFYDYLKENCSDHEKLWKDFLMTLEKEYVKIQGLPPEQQAEAIGKITGNVIATILGAKAMNMAIKSGKLRLKFKAPETMSEMSANSRAPMKFRAAEKPKTKTTPLSRRQPKAVTNIGEVKNWADLEGFVSTIDRVRFKE